MTRDEIIRTLREDLKVKKECIAFKAVKQPYIFLCGTGDVRRAG
jgi:hypothetical protein